MKTRIVMVDRRTFQAAKSYARDAEGTDAGDVVGFAVDCLTALLIAIDEGGGAPARPTAMRPADVLTDFARVVVQRHSGPIPEGSPPMAEA